LRKEKLKTVRRREGRYLVRTNLTDSDPAKLWGLYLQLVAVEEAFRNLKGDLAIRPIFQEERIEALIFISFPAIACTSHWDAARATWRRDSRRAVCWRSLQRCR
jgi:hypothetical protein